MKKIKTKKYLVIGNVATGYDMNILNILSNVAKHHDAQVIHTGDICTNQEKLMYERRVRKIRTFEINMQKNIESKENQLRVDISRQYELIEKYEAELEYSEESGESDAKIGKWTNKIAKCEEAIERKEAKLEEYSQKQLLKQDTLNCEIEALVLAGKHRVDDLIKVFPNIKFVANIEQYLESPPKKHVGSSFDIGSHLVIQSVNANGKKISTQPITDRAYKYLKKLKKSAIVPHAIPALRSYEKPSKKKLDAVTAWNFYTTGSLYFEGEANRPSEYYKANTLPSALLVSFDRKNDEFHASRLHFDFIKSGKKGMLGVLLDSQFYTQKSVIDVGGKNTAAGLTDSHAPWHDERSLACYIGLAELSKAETVIHLGDAADWTSISNHLKSNLREKEGLRFLEDIKAFGAFMRRMGSATKYIKEKILVDANHEYWIKRYIDEKPELIGICDQETIYAQEIPDWEYHIPANGQDYTRYYGDLALRHGDKESVMKAAKMFDKYIGGHFHQHNEILRVGSCGASCKLNPGYLRGNITGWQDCIFSVTRYKGVSSFDIKTVLGNDKVARFSYQGEVYEVKVDK